MEAVEDKVLELVGGAGDLVVELVEEGWVVLVELLGSVLEVGFVLLDNDADQETHDDDALLL